ncbi:hypothetical protein HMPREF9069_01133 [Atopobium sp. oral taxon 810 str. F0209]|nr:hypothetical protein HMPREF9069_01133 [Atopobium sp. oral taxon 810 str. F0209]
MESSLGNNIQPASMIPPCLPSQMLGRWQKVVDMSWQDPILKIFLDDFQVLLLEFCIRPVTWEVCPRYSQNRKQLI